VFVQDLFDVLEGDLLSTAVDERVDPPDDGQVAISVKAVEITGEIPAFGKTPRRATGRLRDTVSQHGTASGVSSTRPPGLSPPPGVDPQRPISR
jgi:hypothetical protein